MEASSECCSDRREGQAPASSPCSRRGGRQERLDTVMTSNGRRAPESTPEPAAGAALDVVGPMGWGPEGFTSPMDHVDGDGDAQWLVVRLISAEADRSALQRGTCAPLYSASNSIQLLSPMLVVLWDGLKGSACSPLPCVRTNSFQKVKRI